MSIKAKLLAGTSKTAIVEVPEWATDDFDGTVTIRPLTDGEQEEVEAAMVAGQTVRGTAGQRPRETEIDASKANKGRRTARRIGAAYGMSVDGDKWRPDEVGKLAPAGVKRVFDAVMELSGGDNWEKAGEEQQAATFRDGTRGPSDRDPASDGDAAGDDSA